MSGATFSVPLSLLGDSSDGGGECGLLGAELAPPVPLTVTGLVVGEVRCGTPRLNSAGVQLPAAERGTLGKPCFTPHKSH